MAHTGCACSGDSAIELTAPNETLHALARPNLVRLGRAADRYGYMMHGMSCFGWVRFVLRALQHMTPLGVRAVKHVEWWLVCRVSFIENVCCHLVDPADEATYAGIDTDDSEGEQGVGYEPVCGPVAARLPCCVRLRVLCFATLVAKRATTAASEPCASAIA